MVYNSQLQLNQKFSYTYIPGKLGKGLNHVEAMHIDNSGVDSQLRTSSL